MKMSRISLCLLLIGGLVQARVITIQNSTSQDIILTIQSDNGPHKAGSDSISVGQNAITTYNTKYDNIELYTAGPAPKAAFAVKQSKSYEVSDSDEKKINYFTIGMNGKSLTVSADKR